MRGASQVQHWGELSGYPFALSISFCHGGRLVDVVVLGFQVSNDRCNRPQNLSGNDFIERSRL